MLTALDTYYSKQPEPIQGCLFALKNIIMGVDGGIVHTRKFQIPFFIYKDWRLAFIWVYRKKIMFSIVYDRQLQPAIQGARRKDGMGFTILIDPSKDIPIEEILDSLHQQIKFYDSMEIGV